MTETTLVFLWVRAFGLTLLAELGVAVPLLAPTTAPVWRRAVIVAIAQLATHPVVWFVIPALHLPRARFLLIAELWAILAEAAVYRTVFASLTFRRALVISLAANAASLLVGSLLR